MLKESKNNNINNKRQRYQSALYDKRILKNIKQELDEQEKNKNYFLHEKIKQQYYEGKTNKLKKNLTKKNEEFIEEENQLLFSSPEKFSINNKILFSTVRKFII